MTIIKQEYVTPKTWTTAEYHRLIEIGVLSSEDKIELLDGQIVEMSPAGNYHAACIEFLGDELKRLLSKDFMIRRQNPILLANNSEPEPDLAIVKYRKDYYAHAHPGPEDILLLIEVADTSLAKDRHIKSVLYAEANIPEYWIMNTEEDLLEQFIYPENGRYKQQRIYSKGELLESPLLPALEISSLWL